MWCVLRILYVMVFLACDPTIADFCDNKDGCPDTAKLDVNTNLILYIVATVMSVFMFFGDIFDFIRWVYHQPPWLYKHVYGPKYVSMHHVFFSDFALQCVSNCRRFVCCYLGMPFHKSVAISGYGHCDYICSSLLRVVYSLFYTTGPHVW